ncbi:MAG: SCO family protein [Leptonema sp. (in: bacteria)]
MKKNLQIAISIIYFFILGCNRNPIVLKDYGQMENFTLIDQNSQKREFYSIKGKAMLLFFGYSHCPDYCPATLSKLFKVQQEFPEDAKPIIIFITVDPERDTPEILNEYIKKILYSSLSSPYVKAKPEMMNEYISKYEKNIIGFTGKKTEIEEIAKKLGIYFRIEKHGSHIHIEHTTSTFLLDKDYKIRYIFPFKESKKKIIEGILASYKLN